jgi:hypothetical protein
VSCDRAPARQISTETGPDASVKSGRDVPARGTFLPQGVASPLDCQSVHPSALRRVPCVRRLCSPDRLGICCRGSSFFFILVGPTFCPPSGSSSCEESLSKVTSQVDLAQTSARLQLPRPHCCFRSSCVDWTGLTVEGLLVALIDAGFSHWDSANRRQRRPRSPTQLNVAKILKLNIIINE